MENNTEVKKVKKSEQTFDMGKGSVWSVFKRIWIPTIISSVIAGTFVVFDTLFVSQGYHLGTMGGGWSWGSETSSWGVSALAWVTPYTFIILGVGGLVGIGISQKMVKAKAAKNDDAYQRAYNSWLPTVIITGGVITVFYFLSAKFLIWMGSGFQPYMMQNWTNVPILSGMTDASTDLNQIIGQQFSQATLYLRVQALGAIPYLIMVSGQQILRVEGKAFKATSFSVASLVTNIVLDFLFICVLGLNLFGAALATVIAQIVAALLYLDYFKNKFPVKLGAMDWGYAKSDFSQTRKLGGTSFLLQGINAFIILSVTMGIGFTNYNDITAISVYQTTFQAYFSLFTFVSLIVIATTFTMSPIVSYNHAIGEYGRVKETKRIATKITLIFATTVALLFVLFPQIVNGFLDDTIKGIAGAGYSQRIMQILFISFIPFAYSTLTANYFSAVGERQKGMIMVLGRAILLFPTILVLGFSLNNVTPNTNGFLLANDLQAITTDIMGNPLVDTNGDSYSYFLSMGIFWAIAAVEVPIFLTGLYFNIQVNNKEQINEINHVKENISQEELDVLKAEV